ncbi:hypothetical protein BCV69DRAFT_275449 [Microstroma glucosiphilum]|uniref:Alpha/beta-hydrolase n=1 Tax=Pseudomicrostroma glucosiphilum TaxID=1684307 RepID=A0A316UGR1_9BASI|nr:hypothetical protein BCV69DRAFT_275449 [Pseudomicrostroma glucosiphilum]PWN24114.1 hypothetical protein BCV69DRAFT_275449 [Pseudomicrostroma glucosiphilum]
MPRTVLPLATFLLLVIAAHLAVAQQYVGSSYTNSMPHVSGSEITFWNIADAQGNSTSLLNYQSLGANGSRLSPSQIRKAVISLHGLQQDPDTIMTGMLAALKKAHLTDSSVSQDTISMVVPLFANTDQANQAYPFVKGAVPAAAGSTSQALVWTSVNWAGGFNNVYPYQQTTVSSFAVLDQMLQYFDNKTLFPSLNEIVVAGHSAGGQAINRYAAIGKDLDLTTPVRYWIANAGNWLWFDSSRPVYRNPGSICSTYDAWRAGLGSNLVAYNKALTSQGTAAVLDKWHSRSKIYARGLQDNGDASADCSPFASGQNRRERFFAQLETYPPTSDDNVDYANVGHDASAFFLSSGAQARFFFDNFDGDGSRSPDFGDRQQIGDSPDPNPDNAPPAPVAGPGWNGTSYQGCWVDYSPTATHILPVVANRLVRRRSESGAIACEHDFIFHIDGEVELHFSRRKRHRDRSYGHVLYDHSCYFRHIKEKHQGHHGNEEYQVHLDGEVDFDKDCPVYHGRADEILFNKGCYHLHEGLLDFQAEHIVHKGGYLVHVYEESLFVHHEGHFIFNKTDFDSEGHFVHGETFDQDHLFHRQDIFECEIGDFEHQKGDFHLEYKEDNDVVDSSTHYLFHKKDYFFEEEDNVYVHQEAHDVDFYT